MLTSFRNSVRYRLAVVVLWTLLLFAFSTLVWEYWSEYKVYEGQTEEAFSLAADTLQNDTIHWLQDREKEILMMAANPAVREYAQAAATGSPDAVEAGERLERFWRNTTEQYAIYDEIFFATGDGRVVLSTDAERKGDRPQNELISETLETGKIRFQDVCLSPRTYRPCIAFSVPVTGLNDGSDSDYTGVLVYRVDINTGLQPLLEAQVDLGETGEVLLVNREGTVLMDLRHEFSSAPHSTLDTEPAQRAIQGQEGLIPSVGYNGEDILTAYRYIPQTGWGLLVRQETGELYGVLRTHMLRSVAENFLIIILMLGLIYYLLGRVMKPVTAMAEAAKQIGEGNFSHRVDVKTNDELGVLGHTLNAMATRIEQHLRLHKCRNDVLHTLVSTLKTNELLNRSLTTVCESYGFGVGAVFLADSEKGILNRMALYCPGEQLLGRREVIQFGEGLEGLVAATAEVKVIEKMPEDTVYTVDWLGGNMRPACIVAVPLLLGNQVLGVMGLASLNCISEVEKQQLAVIGKLIGVALYDTLSHEKTLELSEQLQDANEQLVQQNEELNAQSEELMSQTEELQAQTEELRVQSEELQRLTRELEAKNTELEKLGERKSLYLASLSHELRTPLNAVISFSDVLLDQVVGKVNEKQAKLLKEIYNSGQHLLNLINDLLDLSRIEAGEMELNIKETDPAVPLQEALAMIDGEIQVKELEIVNLIKPDCYLVATDPDRLKQIFLNLLTNAVKFTPDSGRVTIGAEPRDRYLHLWVEDTGIGIEPKYHEEIFEEFRQGGNSFGQYGGTGLGLAITKKMLELNGGRIWVESEAGKGAKFTFTLPLAPVDEPVEPRPFGPEAEPDRAEVVYLSKPLDGNALLAHLERVKTRLDGKQPTILLVDDDPAVRGMVTAVLKPRGYALETAQDGRQGVVLATTGSPDVIILDILMPEMDGFEVLDRLSKHRWEKCPTVFICTFKDFTREEKEYIQSRIKDMHAQP